MFVFGQIGCIRAKFVLLGQGRCIPSKWLYSGRVVVVGQSGYTRATWLYSGKRGCNQARWLYLDKGCRIWAKVVVLR